MDLVPQGVLAGLQQIVNDSLPDSATNLRTNVTSPCRVNDTKRDERGEGLPSFIRFRRFRIKLPLYGTGGSEIDAVAGDTVTVTNGQTNALRGTYYVIDTGNPATYAVSTNLYCVRIKDAAGHSVLPLPTPVQVWNFSSNAAHIQTHAYLYDASSDLHVYPAASGFTWAAVLDKTLGIKANWKIQWTDRDGVVQTGTIKTIREPGGVLPLMVGYVLIDKG